jgi:perosamine synthetase
MSNINAAIGLAQLKKFESFVEKKKDIVHRYNEAFRGIEGLTVLNWNLDDTAPFTYILKVLNDRREELIAFLAKRGIGTGIHYIPNHIQPFFKEYSTSLPVTDEIGEQILTLPLFYDMTEEEIRSVIRSVSEFFL